MTDGSTTDDATPPITGTAEPDVSAALALLVVSVFWHARLGLQVVIEDYVHEAGSKFGLILLLNLATIGGAAFGLVSIARLAFGGAA